jgi:prepilin-type N-terminal cleavage/methylation domain-containing protein
MMAKHGFTLLEVMVALAILAFLMAAITASQGSSLLYGARVFNLTTATQLADGVILELEEEYRMDGFPENSKEEQACELPDGFDRFDCEYDLFGLEIGSDVLSSQAESATESVGDSPLLQGLCSGGPGGSGLVHDPLAAMGQMDVNTASLGALQALVNPDYAALCGMNLQKMCANIPLLAGFIPMIVEQAARTTRKLVVRLSWDERGEARKTATIETFIVSTTQAEQDAL